MGPASLWIAMARIVLGIWAGMVVVVVVVVVVVRCWGGEVVGSEGCGLG